MSAYLDRLDHLPGGQGSFAERMRAFRHDRYMATHLLGPALEAHESAFLTTGNDEKLQRAWARENGLPANLPLDEILLAQIEAHRAEVFYTHDAIGFPSSFVRRLPGCVKKSIAWRAAPSGNVDFGAYDLILSSFPSFLEAYRQQGWRSAYFAPAHDPEMDAYAANADRPLDVLFVGSYTRHHRFRSSLLDAVATLRDRHRIAFHLDCTSRFLRLAESPLGLIGPLRQYRRPRPIRAVGQQPIFGRELYAALSRAKIVLNCSIDIAGTDRGNMRCWEAMGCGAALLSDSGRYPEGMVAGQTMVTYDSIELAIGRINELLSEPGSLTDIAREGHRMIKSRYSKDEQWKAFCALVS